MISQIRQGEDIEHYADGYEERQEVLREIHESDSSNSFPEEDERESRKAVAQQKAIY